MDLGDGVLPLPVLADLVVHLSRELLLSWSKLRLLPTGSPTSSSGSEPVAGALGHQSVLELSDRPGDLKEQPPDCSGSVDALIEHDEVNAARLEELGKFDQMLKGSPEPVEFRDDKLITLTVCHEERLLELRAA
jgi:hypothetical protein